VTSLAANVASLATGLGAVASDVARLVAIIAALHRKAAGIVATLRAAACHVTSLVAVVTTQLRSLSKNSSVQCVPSISQITACPCVQAAVDAPTNLLTVFRNVTDTVAAIAKILILLALARKVSKLVAFKALLSASSKPAVSVASTISSATAAALWALPRKVAHTVTFVTRARTHFFKPAIVQIYI